MSSTWKSLLWKEWREQRWKMAALAAIAVCVTLAVGLGILYSEKRVLDATASYLGFMTTANIFYVMLAGTFVGMSTSGGENSRHTLRFLQAVPAPICKAAIVKIVMAIVSVVVPLLLMFASLYGTMVLTSGGLSNITRAIQQSQIEFVIRDHGLGSWFVIQATAGVLGVVSLMLWMAAAGVNRSDEIRAGAIGFLVCVSAWLVFGLITNGMHRHSPALGAVVMNLAPALPGGSLTLLEWILKEKRSITWIGLIVGVISHGAILAWYLKRFGRVAVSPNYAGGVELKLFQLDQTLDEPMRSQWRAIAWKQLRETGPLAALAVASILLIVPLVHYFGNHNRSLSDYGNILGGVSLSVGFFVILVAGIGVFLEDFAPGVNNFWRSRPVNVNTWFAVKYVTGLAVLALAFGTLLLVANWLREWQLGTIEDAGFYFFFFVLLYTLALAAYVLVRQPIYAAILAIAVIIAGQILLGYFRYRWISFVGEWSIFYTLIILTLAIPTAIAYIAVKHDWGWKAGR